MRRGLKSYIPQSAVGKVIIGGLLLLWVAAVWALVLTVTP